MARIGDTTSLLATWRGVGVSVECHQVRGDFEVRTLRGGQVTRVQQRHTESRARDCFESTVADIVNNGRPLVKGNL